MRLSALRLLGLCCIAGIMLALLGAYALLASYVYLQPSLPTVDAMRTGSLAAPLRVYARDGGLIDEIGEKRRLPVAYEDIPLLVRDAFVAAEDERFFQHHGFDYSGVLRAAWVDLGSGDFSQGASTITMQAARNMFLSFDKTIRRKLQEIFLTYRMEHEFTKEQILGTYLNVIFLGQRSYGVAAAAQTYFGKPLDQLTVAEAATLAGHPAGTLALQPDLQSARRQGAAALRARADAQARRHRCSDRTAGRGGAGAGARSRQPLRGRGTLRRRDGARRAGEPLRRGCGQRRATGSTPPSMGGCRRRPTARYGSA